MGYYDEDYGYNEEEYYDEDDIIEKALEIRTKQIVAEARKHLKKEVQEEINSLKSELAKYKDIKENYDKFAKEKEQLAERKKELEEEYQNKLSNLEKDFYSKKINDLFPENLFKPLYEIITRSAKQPKCPYCNEDRNYIVTTPDGITHQIACKCQEDIAKYFVIETQKVRLYLYKKSGQDMYSKLCVQITGDTSWYVEYGNKVIDKFDEKNPPAPPWDVYFSSKEEAQKYADFLNKKYEEQNK